MPNSRPPRARDRAQCAARQPHRPAQPALPRRDAEEPRRASARATAARLALLHIDLDRFKQINDTLGHAAGDAMLVHAAEVLQVDNAGPRISSPASAATSSWWCRTSDGGRGRAGRPGRPASSAGCASRRPLQGARVPLRRVASASPRSGPADRPQPPADQCRHRALPGQEPRPQPPRILHRGAAGRSGPHQADGRRDPARPRDTTSSSPTTSRSSMPRRSTSSGSRRWRAGIIRPRASLAPGLFLDVAEELNVVSTIDRMILEQALRRFRPLGRRRASTCPGSRSTSRRAGCRTSN